MTKQTSSLEVKVIDDTASIHLAKKLMATRMYSWMFVWFVWSY